MSIINNRCRQVVVQGSKAQRSMEEHREEINYQANHRSKSWFSNRFLKTTRPSSLVIFRGCNTIHLKRQLVHKTKLNWATLHKKLKTSLQKHEISAFRKQSSLFPSNPKQERPNYHSRSPNKGKFSKINKFRNKFSLSKFFNSNKKVRSKFSQNKSNLKFIEIRKIYFTQHLSK